MNNQLNNSARFIRRFPLKPTQFTRFRTNCVLCNEDQSICNLTKEDLDMRRKAEVLQYNNNSKLKGSLTKAEKYSQMVRGKGPNKQTYGSQTQSYTNPNILEPALTNPTLLPIKYAYNNKNQIKPNFISKKTENCGIIKTSTHASNVPGPEKLLYYDKTIPLTNYVTIRNYSGNHDITKFMFIPKTRNNNTYFISNK